MHTVQIGRRAYRVVSKFYGTNPDMSQREWQECVEDNAWWRNQLAWKIREARAAGHKVSIEQ